MAKIIKILLWVAGAIVLTFVLIVLVRLPHNVDTLKTQRQVEQIHNTKLTLDDVLGVNLPPDPGEEADKTVAGVDANGNGIRDDVELAIFKEYPNSAKTRAVLLQYALALQMEVVQPIVNKGTVTAVVSEQSRADACIADTLVPRKSLESYRDNAEIEEIDKYINFVKDRQLNTDIREKERSDFFKQLGSYHSLDSICDIDYTTLPN